MPRPCLQAHLRREVLPSCIVVYYAQLVVKFNFGPNFNFFPQDFGRLPIPQPMRSELPRQAIEVKIDVPAENGIARKFDIMWFLHTQGVRYATSSRMGYAKALPSKTFQDGGIYYPAAFMYTLPI